MKTLLTIVLLAFAGIASAQTTPCQQTCGTNCTKPVIVNVTHDVSTGVVGVGWNNAWFWGSQYGCSKGITVVINGVEQFGNDSSYVHPNAVSGWNFPGLAIPGAVYNIVVRNYCVAPRECGTANYIDSDVWNKVIPTNPNTPPTAIQFPLDCKCANGKKWQYTNGTTIACGPKKKCEEAVADGWVSSCNCQ